LWQKSPNGGKNHQMVAKIAKWWQKSSNGSKNRQMVAKITEWWQKSRQMEVKIHQIHLKVPNDHKIYPNFPCQCPQK
jgi:hypothetical protein